MLSMCIASMKPTKIHKNMMEIDLKSRLSLSCHTSKKGLFFQLIKFQCRPYVALLILFVSVFMFFFEF
jgi:hypothetical protein